MCIKKENYRINLILVIATKVFLQTGKSKFKIHANVIFIIKYQNAQAHVKYALLPKINAKNVLPTRIEK